ncbi:unnamed protein product [Agarophyton chilense]
MTSAFLAPKLLLTHKQLRMPLKRCPARRPYQVCSAAKAKPSSIEVNTPPVVEALAERLKRDLVLLFDPSQPSDYSLFSTDFLFEDPLTKIRGLKRYEKHITFLERSILFSDAQFNLFDLRVIGDRRDTIRTRWFLSMVVNLPWRPCVTFTGQSDYFVDIEKGKIVGQADYWDSLDDSSFFSAAAVKDFVTQVVPGQSSGGQDDGFKTLRRTRDFELRSYESSSNSEGVFLKEFNNSSPVSKWKVSSKHSNQGKGVTMTKVAVTRLNGAPKSSEDFIASERKLRDLLSYASFAEAGETCIYVEDLVQGRSVHELWLELSDVSANVDV